jgi:uncharacterized membrane protein YgdD (TMEM256/DUF423 family)
MKMSKDQKNLLVIGSVLILLGIVLGAFGAHGLKNILQDYPEKLTSFETGVRYQMYMGFSFLILSFLSDKLNVKLISKFWLIGTIFFSLSIYLLTITPILKLSLKFLGPITPIGGLLLIIGWFLLILQLIKKQ